MKINELIRNIQSGDSNSVEELLIAMQPLLKKYASKIYFLEFDDAYQELSITLLESIKYIHDTSNENACLSYLKQSILHKKYALTKKFSSINSTEFSWDNDMLSSLTSNSNFSDIIFDIDFTNFLNSLSGKEYDILKMIYINHYSDSEIANKLNLSRQYVNRVKKKILQKSNLFSK